MFREDVGATFSEIWYRVGPTRPRLSRHAQIIRQQHGAQVSYILEDPAGGQFYRLSESAYFFAGLLDGTRTVDEAWDACNAQLGDDAPTQRECVEVLSRLQLYGLLLGDLPLASDMVLERKRQVKATRVLKRTGRWMFFVIPLINPEPFLEKHKAALRLVFSRWGAAAWGVAFLTALWFLIPRWRDFTDGLDVAALMQARNIVSMGLLFLFLRALHEFGHAAACKAMGGRSTEIGVILVAGVLPIPFCDTTSSWRFPETWRRVLVAAAGMIVETFFACIAAVLWAVLDEQYQQARSLCYQTVLVSGVTTILFNANPLLRYDGYYILSDITGTPNLAQRSKEVLVYLIERFAFGLRGSRPPAVRDRAQGWLLILYGVLSTPYRVFITASIILVIAQRYLTLGLVLAVILSAVWLVWPLLKGMGYLSGSPRLMGRRGRAFAVAGGIAAVLLVALVLIPMPAAAYAPAVVVAEGRAPVRSGEAGFITQVLVPAGATVNQGDPLFILENPEVIAERDATAARLASARAELDAATVHSPEDARVAERRVAHLVQAAARAGEHADGLVVRAPISGTLSPATGSGIDLANLPGKFIPRGRLLAEITPDQGLIVRAVVSDKERAYIFKNPDGPKSELPDASCRVRGASGRASPAKIDRIVPAGTREVVEPALLTAAGGEVPLDPGDPEGKRTLVPYFIVDVRPESLPPGVQPGLRARVRFDAGLEPLATQWWRTLRQYLAARISR